MCRTHLHGARACRPPEIQSDQTSSPDICFNNPSTKRASTSSSSSHSNIARSRSDISTGSMATEHADKIKVLVLGLPRTGNSSKQPLGQVSGPRNSANLTCIRHQSGTRGAWSPGSIPWQDHARQPRALQIILPNVRVEV